MKNVKTVIISEELHKQLLEHCNNKNIKIGKCIEHVLKTYLLTDDKSILPMILIDYDEILIEKIECTTLSSEYKNNMPICLTLLRTSKDGSGYIGNYSLK